MILHLQETLGGKFTPPKVEFKPLKIHVQKIILYCAKSIILEN